MKTVILIQAKITLEMLPENYNGIVNLREQHDKVMLMGTKEFEEIVRKRFEKKIRDDFNGYNREEGILNEVTFTNTECRVILVSGHEIH